MDSHISIQVSDNNSVCRNLSKHPHWVSLLIFYDQLFSIAMPVLIKHFRYHSMKNTSQNEMLAVLSLGLGRRGVYRCLLDRSFTKINERLGNDWLSFLFSMLNTVWQCEMVFTMFTSKPHDSYQPMIYAEIIKYFNLKKHTFEMSHHAN